MRRALAIAVGCLLASFASPSLAEQQGLAKSEDRTEALPIQMVRTLQLMQDQIAVGSANAHVAQRALLAHIDESYLAMDPRIWRDSRSVHAAVVFVLSGGKPNILRKLLSLSVLDETNGPIVQGALAYVEGREVEARRFLSNIDTANLPATLGGQIALVQSALYVREDAKKAIQLLDSVRLQLPGTLLEEAALRREIFVASQIGDIQKFETLSRQYLRRFRYSVYAGNFRQRFAAALTQLEFSKDPQHFTRLEIILDELNPEGQRELYLMVARLAIDQGQAEIAVRASDKALALSLSDKVSSERARLYKAAALIVTTEGFEGGLASLKRTNREVLPDSDKSLLESALQLADHIRKAPESVKSTAFDAGLKTPPAESRSTDNALPAISRAQEALGRVDQLFQKDTR